MEAHQVLKSCYIPNFELAYIFEIEKKMRDLYRDDLEAWSDFEGILKYEFYDGYFDKVIKRSFLK